MQRHRQTQSCSASALGRLPTVALAAVAMLAACNRAEQNDEQNHDVAVASKRLPTNEAQSDRLPNDPRPNDAVSPEPSTPARDTRVQGSEAQQTRSACPMLVDDVSVEFEELPGTAALNFRTGGGDVEELQRRVSHMARMYEMHDDARGSALWQHERHGRGRMDRQGMGRRGQPELVAVIPPSTAKVDFFADGARLVLRPTEPDDLELLRERLRSHAEHLEAGECWMTGTS
jgi:hypothetical protein